MPKVLGSGVGFRARERERERGRKRERETKKDRERKKNIKRERGGRLSELPQAILTNYGLCWDAARSAH